MVGVVLFLEALTEVNWTWVNGWVDWAEMALGLGGLVVVTGFSLDWNWILVIQKVRLVYYKYKDQIVISDF